jgi:hypothetical protein
VELNPKDADSFKGLALVLDTHNKRKEARQYWEKALKSEKAPEKIDEIKKRLAEPD